MWRVEVNAGIVQRMVAAYLFAANKKWVQRLPL